jgi:hypothetical protein
VQDLQVGGGRLIELIQVDPVRTVPRRWKMSTTYRCWGVPLAETRLLATALSLSGRFDAVLTVLSA